MYSLFLSYPGFCSTEEDQIHNRATLYVAYPILWIPFLLMALWLQEQGHQQGWYWLNKPEYSVFSIRRVKWRLSWDLFYSIQLITTEVTIDEGWYANIVVNGSYAPSLYCVATPGSRDDCRVWIAIEAEDSDGDLVCQNGYAQARVTTNFKNGEFDYPCGTLVTDENYNDFSIKAIGMSVV